MTLEEILIKNYFSDKALFIPQDYNQKLINSTWFSLKNIQNFSFFNI